MRHYALFLLLSSLPLQSNSAQIPWKKETVQGFPIADGELETTEGFGAYIDFCLKPNTKNFDNGGGTHNYNSQFLKKYHGVINIVYDPYQRDEKENLLALEEVKKNDFDTTTSNSVLNVIDTEEARLKHIALSCQALKEGGIAYFKVYPGDSSHKELREEGRFQSNRPAKTYQEEVEKIFGKGNVVVDVANHKIIAYKNSGCHSQTAINNTM